VADEEVVDVESEVVDEISMKEDSASETFAPVPQPTHEISIEMQVNRHNELRQALGKIVN